MSEHVFLVRDVAQLLRTTSPTITQLLVACGRPGLSVNSAISPEDAQRCADALEMSALREAALLPQIADQIEIMMASSETLGGGFVEGYKIKTGALHRIIGLLAGAGCHVVVPLPTAPAVEPDNAAVMRQTLEAMKLAKWVMPHGLPGSNYANASAALEASIAALGGDFKPPVHSTGGEA